MIKYKLFVTSNDILNAYAVVATMWARSFSYCDGVLTIDLEEDIKYSPGMLQTWIEGLKELK